MSDCSRAALRPKARPRIVRVYVIGPVTGIPGGNLWEFERARDVLEGAGYEAEIPHDSIPEGTPWGEAMRRSVRRLTYADAVVYLDGTAQSRGARLERKLARSLGVPVFSLAWVEARGGRLPGIEPGIGKDGLA